MTLHPKYINVFQPQRDLWVRSVALGAAVSLLLAVTGCGSDSSSATRGGSGSSPPSLVASSGPTTVTVSATTEPAPTTRPPTTDSTTGPDSAMLKGPVPTSKIDQPTAARLQAVLDEVVAVGTPDAIAAVITPNGTWAGAAGVDGPNGRTAKADDEFAIASISKTFTAAMIMRLAEQGKIDLNQPLAAYLGGTDADANDATVEQTLAMRGGLGDTVSTAFDEVYADPSRAWTPAEVVSKIGPPLTPAGTEYHASNPGYKLLGIAAENVTGKSLAEAMSESVLDPVGATRIVMQDPDHLTPQPWALPLKGFEGPLDLAAYGQGSVLPCMSDATFSRNAAGMASDAASLARWAWSLFSGKILQPQSLATMMNFDSDGNGLGVFTNPDFGPAAYGSVGNKPGYGSLLVVLPDRNTVIVMFSNDPDKGGYVAGQLLKAL